MARARQATELARKLVPDTWGRGGPVLGVDRG